MLTLCNPFLQYVISHIIIMYCNFYRSAIKKDVIYCMYIFLNSQVYAIYVTPYFVHVCICTHVCVHICCAYYSMYECTPFAQAECMTHVYIISILMYNISVYTCTSVQSSKYYHYILSLLYTAIYNDTSIMSSVLLPLVVVVAVLCSMVVFDPIAFSCTWLL